MPAWPRMMSKWNARDWTAEDLARGRDRSGGDSTAAASKVPGERRSGSDSGWIERRMTKTVLEQDAGLVGRGQRTPDQARPGRTSGLSRSHPKSSLTKSSHQ